MTEVAKPVEEQPPGVEPPPLAAPPQPEKLRFRFSGSGGEYFRIWLVNLLLTLVTLGIYSAWAKVRRTRYFWSNTQLDGAALQYHGNPVAILRGRILVGAFFAAYSLAGRISIGAGVVAAIVLGLLAPWFFLKAMRFKLTNTTWRGLRFGFDSTVGAAYAALAPAVILWVLLTAELATYRPGEDPNPARFLVMYGIFLALLPLLHARIKRYQHGAATLGTTRFEFPPSAGSFYALYGKGLLVALGPMIVLGVVAVLVVVSTGGPRPESQAGVVVALVPFTVILLAYLVAGSFFVARLQRLVWSRTRCGAFGFASDVRARRLLGVWLKNGLLTLLTLGLYWPYAAVAIARYRIESMTLEAGAPLASLAAGGADVEPSAAGEGAVDLFGWDVGL